MILLTALSFPAVHLFVCECAVRFRHACFTLVLNLSICFLPPAVRQRLQARGPGRHSWACGASQLSCCQPQFRPGLASVAPRLLYSSRRSTHAHDLPLPPALDLAERQASSDIRNQHSPCCPFLLRAALIFISYKGLRASRERIATRMLRWKQALSEHLICVLPHRRGRAYREQLILALPHRSAAPFPAAAHVLALRRGGRASSRRVRRHPDLFRWPAKRPIAPCNHRETTHRYRRSHRCRAVPRCSPLRHAQAIPATSVVVIYITACARLSMLMQL